MVAVRLCVTNLLRRRVAGMLAVAVLIALVVGNVAAAFPARTAAQTRAAVVLRSE